MCLHYDIPYRYHTFLEIFGEAKPGNASNSLKIVQDERILDIIKTNTGITSMQGWLQNVYCRRIILTIKNKNTLDFFFLIVQENNLMEVIHYFKKCMGFSIFNTDLHSDWSTLVMQKEPGWARIGLDRPDFLVRVSMIYNYLEITLKN